MRVGIPRALLYYHYGDCWLAFLESLGVEVVVSEPTTGEIIATGASLADNETCLPVKVFLGHLMALKEASDYALVPRVVSHRKGTCSCPKFLGLPDMACAVSPEAPPILAPAMDLGDPRGRWLRRWYGIARLLGGGPVGSATAVVRLIRLLEQKSRRPDPRGGGPA